MLAKRLARLGLAVSGGTLIGVLSQKASSASVPTSVVSSTIKAATPVAAGQAAAGLISVKAAILTEGVLKAMTTTKIKTVLLAFLVVAIAGMGLGGVFYKTQAVEPRAVLPVKKDKNIHADQPALPGDKHGEQLEKLKSEVEQLRADNKELKKRLQKQIRKGSSTDVKLVTLVLPLSALTSLIGPALPDQSEAKPLIRVITRTIEPASWSDMGGDGSIEYLSAWGSLVVRQSPAIVEQVEQLLQNLLDNKEELEKQKKK